MRYYIHILLPEGLRNAVLAVEKEYQGKSKSDPRITIIPPGVLIKEWSEQELIDAIRGAVKYSNRPLIAETGVGHFENREGDKETIYIDIQRTPTLLWLHRSLVDAVADILNPSNRRSSSVWSVMPKASAIAANSSKLGSPTV